MDITEHNEEAWEALEALVAESKKDVRRSFEAIQASGPITSPTSNLSQARAAMAEMTVTHPINRLYANAQTPEEWHAIHPKRGTSLYQYACASGLAMAAAEVTLADDNLHELGADYLYYAEVSIERVNQKSNLIPLNYFPEELQEAGRQQDLIVNEMLEKIRGAIKLAAAIDLAERRGQSLAEMMVTDRVIYMENLQQG